MVKIIIPNETLPSWNKHLRAHWGKQKATVDYWNQLVWVACKEQKIQNMTHNGRTLAIHTTCYFKNRRTALDPDNIVDKIVIDPLKGMVIKDDSFKYVRYTTTESRVDSENPRTEILISYV